MTAIRIVVAGAAGRMGRTLIREIMETEGSVLAGAFEHPDSRQLGLDAGVLAGLEPLGLTIAADPLPLIANTDALIDFSAPAASLAHAAFAAQARIVHVIGTTGFSSADEAKLAAAARHATIVRSGNFSLGVNLLAVMTKKLAQVLGPQFDIEILEMHHRHKADAPSGTALMLGRAAAEGRGVSLESEAVHARQGQTGPRPIGSIGFAVLRGGSVVGEHSVMFAADKERITLSHSAEDRSIFARGAVRAALWAQGKKPGLYSMADVLALD